jgi:hypothetical protein
LVASDHGAEQDDEHDDHPGQVLHPPIAEREAPAGSQAGEREGDPQRYGSQSVPEVVDHVGEQRDAARDDDHHDLQEGCDEQAYERPLHGPHASLGGRYGRVDRAMGVAVLFVSMLMVVRHASSILPRELRLSGKVFTHLPK